MGYFSHPENITTLPNSACAVPACCICMYLKQPRSNPRQSLSATSRFVWPQSTTQLLSARGSPATNRLIVPSVKLSIVGSRTFPAAASSIWNTLPKNLVSASVYGHFGSKTLRQ